MMKNYFIAIFMVAFPFLIHSQDQENQIKLKQINVVKTNYRDSKSGEIENKTVLFKEGKLLTIKTSDVIQSFFYNPKGLLDMTVKERTGSNWKEVVNYSYDKEDRITKFSKKYDENGETVIKTVTMNYEGARIKVITKKSNVHTVMEDIEYVVEGGVIIRRSARDRNQQIFNKTEYVYSNDNVIRHKGVLGEKTIKNYTFDDKKSVDLLIVQSLFGPNYKVIVPLISFHEDEFNFESISSNNELAFVPSTTNYTGVAGKYKYNTLNYPISSSFLEQNGIVKIDKTYIYE
ncbi:hypothetical protein OIU83_09935 [Flavobacterium sp. LS1R49]|uniref:Uncharacterized protein n=1 Tax=Flavobacterium shii TaxID=2987687 RepID=A0A9X3C5T0_9FLAO|nr:hypothetical protein [Flavobacterium shii]MCV9927972.1 hypothetical protein [Flavobacterium shii]